MKVELDYKETLQGIVSDVLKMDKVLEADQQGALERIGKTLKKEAQGILPKSDEAAAGYKHMKDDIKVTVHGKKQKTGVTGVTVHGGKETAYKWHMLDDGTRNPDGTVHTQAIHFTDKTMEAAADEIDRIIDDLMGRVTQ